MILPDIFTIVSLDEVYAAIDPAGDLAFDTETIGLYGKIRLAQFKQRQWDKSLIVEYPDPFALFGMFSKLPDTNVIMQFAHYDVTTIQKAIGFPFIPKTFNDTFLLARLAFPNLSEYSLDKLITHVKDFDPYTSAGINKKEMHKAKWGVPVLPFKQLYYAALDTYHLFELYDAIKDQEDSISYRLDISFLRACLDFQNNGLPVNQARMSKLYGQNLKRLDEIDLPINCNSYQQVRPYIGSEQSDDLGLAKLTMQGNERAATVREARKLRKLNSFLDKFDTPDSRIYGTFKPSARSGRCTSSDQNLQQLPRATKFLFGVEPDSGRALIYSDYSQLELRCIAIITGEASIIELYRQGKDLHNYTAEMIFGKDFTKEHRQIAKTANFNLLYGGGAGMFQQILIKQAGVFLSLEACTRVARKWKLLYPKITKWQEQGIRDFQRGSLGSTPFGRQYRGNMMTDQLNIENQGFGAEVAKLATHYMMPKLKKLSDTFICDFVHDSYIVETSSDEAIYVPAAKIVGDCMHEAWVEASKTVQTKDLPMPVKVDVGFNWGDIEDGDYFYRYTIEG